MPAILAVNPGAKTVNAELTPTELAAIVRTEIQNCRKAMSNALDHAMNAGDALRVVEPKILAAGIGWNRWLQDNCFTAKSTAYLYMQLAAHRAEIEAEVARGVELSLRGARKLISPGGSAARTGAFDPDEAPEREESLSDHWRRLNGDARATFLDVIGVQGILDAMSADFGRELRDRVPAKTKPGSKKPKTLNLSVNPAHPRETIPGTRPGNGAALFPQRAPAIPTAKPSEV